VNVLFLDPPFNGRLEKLDSVTAGYLSAVLSLSLCKVMTMDSRIIPLCPGEVEEYLAACQDEAWRNHVFSYGFYTLVKEGMAHDEAMAILRGMKESEIHELLFQRGINLAKTPTWERRGVLVYRRDGEIVEDWELPLLRDEEGQRLLKGILADKKTD
jgi:tRNA(His) 5'-end guanylyltransferase